MNHALTIGWLELRRDEFRDQIQNNRGIGYSARELAIGLSRAIELLEEEQMKLSQVAPDGQSNEREK